MKAPDLTVYDFAHLLEAHGFKRSATHGINAYYAHAASGAEIIVNQESSPRNVAVLTASLRGQLDAFGILDRDEFDEWMRRLRIARKDQALAAAKNGNGRQGRAHGVHPKPRTSNGSPRAKQRATK